ncbi:ribosomal RNA small subunit methyltransferase E [Luteitalea sp. TBR-22]|uniref:RsmE family RNA methyltransferase n=1 Tax=Luteitalea sp. TBR-22 TaxID=2802971 RepID=UPI001AF9F7A7|nr:RsmE family RNA methyltransferase [Luteitalea sp. TBR-22]BCS34084.1 ribosomal RNA small subunit methyltransferase E [Luteitalea sp. TBR-22]
MPHRFFAPDLTHDAPTVVLPPGESLHLARVLRLREGDAVEVFDGRGALHAARVERVAPGGSVLAVQGARAAAPEPPAPIVIVQALLKGDAMDAVVRDATVLGATAILPVVSARTNVPARAAVAAHERWQRVAVAAAKQCGRAVLPTIAAPCELADAVGTALTNVPTRLWLAEPAVSGDHGGEVPSPPQATALAIGPEGGWTNEEVDAARAAGWRPWTMMPVTLRAEHVALAALSVIRYAWDAALRRRMT